MRIGWLIISNRRIRSIPVRFRCRRRVRIKFFRDLLVVCLALRHRWTSSATIFFREKLHVGGDAYIGGGRKVVASKYLWSFRIKNFAHTIRIFTENKPRNQNKQVLVKFGKLWSLYRYSSLIFSVLVGSFDFTGKS